MTFTHEPDTRPDKPESHKKQNRAAAEIPSKLLILRF